MEHSFLNAKDPNGIAKKNAFEGFDLNVDLPNQFELTKSRILRNALGNFDKNVHNQETFFRFIRSLIKTNDRYIQMTRDPESLKKNLEALLDKEFDNNTRNEFARAITPIAEVGAHFANQAPNKRIGLSEALSISTEGSHRIGIHVISQLSQGEFFRSFLEGMRKLVEIVERNSNVQYIEGISWIWNEHPNIARRLGFTIVGTADKKDGLPKNDKRTYLKAEMTREAFLERYKS